MIWVWIVLQGLTLLGVVNYWRHLPVDRREERPDGVVVILSVRDDWDGGAALMARLAAQSAPRLVGRLLFPLVRDKADIVTGYRLLLPGRGLMAAMVGAVEMQLATLPRAASATLPWGGAMALSRTVAERLDLDAVLAGRLSDDMAIGLAGWRAKLRLRPVRDLLVASPLDGRGGDLLGFGVRQYRHIATNNMGMWALATVVIAVQSGAWVWALGRVNWAHLIVQVAAVASNHIRWGGWDYWMQRGKVARMARVAR